MCIFYIVTFFVYLLCNPFLIFILFYFMFLDLPEWRIKIYSLYNEKIVQSLIYITFFFIYSEDLTNLDKIIQYCKGQWQCIHELCHHESLSIRKYAVY